MFAGRRMSAGLFLNVFLLCATATVVGACARGSGLVSAPEETGTIVGRVVDTQSGAPIADAIITISSVLVADVTSDATGHFEIADLPLDSEFVVSASKAGYSASTVTVPVTRSQPFISIEFTLTRF